MIFMIPIPPTRKGDCHHTPQEEAEGPADHPHRLQDFGLAGDVKIVLHFLRNPMALPPPPSHLRGGLVQDRRLRRLNQNAPDQLPPKRCFW
ncbi:hypothetical protein [Candidatus Manganitrophus noduliformans]|uniref:Uncharacterized protein n=1 Tax=Candidatus Manganitrophus noduliformans TaxID=2606439 RepID=A0A7X6ID53_9BACT|nr:hypothetical protein [Candidatus Manganitrophus noduliformans]NKE73541.1 hypothetical protein [Candidatus Manganitrophus noduliformans]